MIRSAPHLKENKMQYWKNFNNGKLERLEDQVFKKHPEKQMELESQGYIRVKSENDDTAYSNAKKRIFKKKKKSKK